MTCACSAPTLAEVPCGETGAHFREAAVAPGHADDAVERRRGLPATYFSNYPGYYETGDAGYIDDDGYVYVIARTDDIINVAGHRLSTSAMEFVLCSHPDVVEFVVIGVADELKGQVPLGFLVLHAGVNRPHDEIIKEVIQMVREQIGPVADFKRAVVVERLPKTRSGKTISNMVAAS